MPDLPRSGGNVPAPSTTANALPRSGSSRCSTVTAGELVGTIARSPSADTAASAAVLTDHALASHNDLFDPRTGPREGPTPERVKSRRRASTLLRGDRTPTSAAPPA